MAGSENSDLFGLVALNDFRKKSGFTCSFMIFAALNLTMLIIGAQNLDQCPVSHMIPVYLIGEYNKVIPLFRIWKRKKLC